jgi:hypothetical protein
MFPAARLQGTEGGDQGYEIWLLLESVPVQGYLPAFQQPHLVKFKLGVSAPCSCSCPHFTSTKLPCCAMCALLASKNIQSIEDIAAYMDKIWLVENHPLFALATQSSAPAAATCQVAIPLISPSVASNVISASNSQAMQQMMLPTDTSGRQAVLVQLFNQLMPTTAASASLCKNLYSLLIQHRTVMSKSQSIIRPPISEVSVAQAACGTGPASAVVNLANVVRTYRRGEKNRIGTARKRDPSCYMVHKTGAPGAEVTCLCGDTHINDHKVCSFNLSALITT